MLTLRAARADDLEAVAAIYRRATQDMDAHGIFQWDGIYPSKAVLLSDIDSAEMLLVCSSEHVVGAVVLNERQDEEYALGTWLHGEPAAVVHRLCIDPACQHLGYGRQAMLLSEAALKARGFRTVRLDAFSQNPHALKLYESLGYRKAGEVTFRKGLFYLYEKSLI